LSVLTASWLGGATHAGGTETQRLIGNALLESALIHLRALDDFFYREPNKDTKDDVFAVDYAGGWTLIPLLTKDERADINKRLAHITTRRTREPRKWELSSMSKARDVYDRFREDLTTTWPVRARWF
jgi:hypothetical protein